MTDGVLDSIRRQLLAFPAASREVADLTDQERIALCIASGCEMDYRTENAADGYRMVASTVRPVGIVKVGGRFVVYQMAPSPNTTVLRPPEKRNKT